MHFNSSKLTRTNVKNQFHFWMQAIVVEQFGAPENLTLKQVPIPSVGKDGVLVKTKAISINPVDVKTRQGNGQCISQ